MSLLAAPYESAGRGQELEVERLAYADSQLSADLRLPAPIEKSLNDLLDDLLAVTAGDKAQLSDLVRKA